MSRIIIRALKALRHPSRILLWLWKKTSFLYSDELYLKGLFRLTMGKKLNLKNPQTFNEKLNWLKLYDRKPEYTKMVDKYAVKEYVASIIGEKYIIPALGVWNTPEKIEWEKLPNQFVLKTTHGGGNCGVVIVKDKKQANINVITDKLNKSLRQDLYKFSREWPYKDCPRRIIAEPYVEDKQTQELRDYKFFCFDGEVKAMFIGSERQKKEEPFFDFYDTNFNLLPIKQGHPNSVNKPSKPICFEEMKLLAAKLSKGIPHVRVDWYEVDGKVLFGEMTFYHFGAVVPFEPEEWDYKFGEWIKLPSKE